ncbi:MAG: glutamine-hydrolyzing GMP synthase [Candidatus Roizmanbacteria bacterium]|nr:glutamine-hydrolyzing GMP synthase [Candidatus Roizmanbacteria bacterium]
MIHVVDFGSQTAHLIARRVRDLGVEVKTVEPENAYKSAQKEKPDGIIFSGGPASVYADGAPTVDKKIFDAGIPILGICYGQQLTAHLLPQGKTEKGTKREDGPATLILDKPCVILEGVSPHSRIWMSHGDTVMSPPEGFEFVAHSETVPSAAMKNDKKKIYGVQFHPEVEHTEHGILVLRNFLEKVCKLKTKKKEIDIKQLISTIRKTVGTRHVLAAVSGGVDSTVAAALVAKAVGKQLTVIYCDNGLMRVGTRDEVLHIFKDLLKVDLRIIDCKDEFLKALKGKIDPEEKRKAIGKLYIDIFERESQKIKNVGFLVQGTIYSDVIESKGTKHADKIKSHHNVGGLPEKMNLTLLEPMRNFYKDEVRKIGDTLGLPKEVVYKQVFPGPGQAIRIIGEVTAERLDKQQAVDKIVLEEIKKADYYYNVYMSFPIMTGALSTSVRGDGRFYGEVVALRIIESTDVMTTVWARLPYDLLQKMVSRITNEVPGVSRVVYDITTKPPATMEWE